MMIESNCNLAIRTHRVHFFFCSKFKGIFTLKKFASSVLSMFLSDVIHLCNYYQTLLVTMPHLHLSSVMPALNDPSPSLLLLSDAAAQPAASNVHREANSY